MTDLSQPKLSALLVVRDELAAIGKTIEHLRKQTVAGQVELVIAGPSDVCSSVDRSEFAEFADCQCVEMEVVSSPACAYAAAIRRASAPVVAFCEDHAFPDPGWAEALIGAHQQTWAAVGPAMRNGNPETTVSWAAFFMAFGPWTAPTTARIVTHLPWHNNSYKRDLLLSYDAKLEQMLEAESVLHWDLINKGHQLYLEPAAQTDHLNVAQFPAWLRFQFHAGRKFAASRCRNWSWLRRLFYCAASPLIPPLRFWRMQQEVLRPGRCLHPNSRVLCVLMAGLVADAMGQMLGNVAGIGKATEKTAEFDLNRSKYL